MRDVAIVSYVSTVSVDGVEETETQMLLPLMNQALERVGLTRKDIGFTCSASCDYLAGAPFAFVQTLEATGAWPPISESHVEMDGAWALYEAWVRLQEGDIDTALVFTSSTATRCDLPEVMAIQLDPYYLAPLWLDQVSVAALQAQALIDAGKWTEPVASGDGAPAADGAAVVVLAAEGRAREVCPRPAWIAGIDHRSDAHYPGVRDLSVSTSARIAAEQAGVDKAPVEVAELCATFSHEEVILREAMGLSGDTKIKNALAANPLMVTGLIRIGEAANQIIDGNAKRVLGHAASGPCLQQNLVCVMEAE